MTPLARPANDNTITGRFTLTRGARHAVVMIAGGIAIAACGRQSRAVYELGPNVADCAECLRAVRVGKVVRSG